jgi:hypothetical protein
MRTVVETRIPGVQEVIAKALANPHSELSRHMAAQAANPAPSLPETPAGMVTRLEAELVALRLKIKVGTDATANGDSETAGQYDLKSLADEVADTLRKLDAARQALAAAERAARIERRAKCEQEFAENMQLAFSARAEFQGAFGIAAPALGAWCAAMQRVNVLDRELRAADGYLYTVHDPAQQERLSDIADRSRLSPLNDLLSQGYKQTMDFGFDLLIQIPPLHAPVKKEQENER